MNKRLYVHIYGPLGGYYLKSCTLSGTLRFITNDQRAFIKSMDDQNVL